MSTSQIPEPTAEVQRQLDLANSQLALYARDLKRIVDAERQKARDLAHANARLQILDRLKTDFLSFIFSPKEKIIGVKTYATAERVALIVADHGQGFTPELAQELFRPFTVADVLYHSCGTGLSLALASAIVAAHGGQMRAESKGLGQGAIFTLEFPRVALPEEAVEEGRAVLLPLRKG